MRGRIELIVGPMFSGKSSELIRRVKRYTRANRECLVIKYKKDTRYTGPDDLSTHDRTTYPAVSAEIKLAEVLEKALTADVVAIDEAQFFVDLVEFAEGLAKLGKTVLVAGLDGDFEQKPFLPMLYLWPHAETILKLTAICDCNADAAFTKRIVESTQQELIGGAESYVAVCRECLYKTKM